MLGHDRRAHLNVAPWAFMVAVWMSLSGFWAAPLRAQDVCWEVVDFIGAGALDEAEAKLGGVTTPEEKQCAIHLIEAYERQQQSAKAQQWLDRIRRIVHPTHSGAIYGAVQYYILLLDPPASESDFNKVLRALRGYAPERAKALEQDVRQRFRVQEQTCRAHAWDSQACRFPARWVKQLRLDTRSMERIRAQVQAYHTLSQPPYTSASVRDVLNILQNLAHKEGVDIGDRAARFRHRAAYFNASERARQASSHAASLDLLLQARAAQRQGDFEDTEQVEARLARRTLMVEIDTGFGTGTPGAIPTVEQVQAWQTEASQLAPDHGLAPAYEAGLHLLLQYHRCQADREPLQPSDPCVAFVSDDARWDKVLNAQGRGIEALQSLHGQEEQALRDKTARALSAARRFLDMRETTSIRDLESLTRRLGVLDLTYSSYVANLQVLNTLKHQAKLLNRALASRAPADIDRLPLTLQRAWDLQPYVTCPKALARIDARQRRSSRNASAYERAREAYRAVRQLSRDERRQCEAVDGGFRTRVEQVYQDYFRTAMEKAFALLSARETLGEGHDVLVQLVSGGDLALPRGSPEYDYAMRKQRLFRGLMAGDAERRLARYYDDPRGSYQYFEGEKGQISAWRDREERLLRGTLWELFSASMTPEAQNWFKREIIPLHHAGRHQKALSHPTPGGGLREDDFRRVTALIYELWGDYRKNELRWADAIQNYAYSGKQSAAYQPHLRKKLVTIIASRQQPLQMIAGQKGLAAWVKTDPEIRQANFERVVSEMENRIRVGDRNSAQGVLAEYQRGGVLQGDDAKRARARLWELWGDFRERQDAFGDAIQNYGISGKTWPPDQAHLKEKILSILVREEKPLHDVTGTLTLAPWIGADPDMSRATAFNPTEASRTQSAARILVSQQTAVSHTGCVSPISNGQNIDAKLQQLEKCLAQEDAYFQIALTTWEQQKTQPGKGFSEFTLSQFIHHLRQANLEDRQQKRKLIEAFKPFLKTQGEYGKADAYFIMHYFFAKRYFELSLKEDSYNSIDDLALYDLRSFRASIIEMMKQKLDNS